MANKVNQQVWNGNLGDLYLTSKKYNKAYKYLKVALKLSRDIPDRYGEGKWLSNLSVFYYKKGDKDKAINYIENSIEIAKECDNINVNARLKLLKEYEGNGDINDKN